jgi:hypothetical protein
MKIPLGLLFDNPISLSASGRVRDSGQCQIARLDDYLRPLQSHISDRIFRRSSRINKIFQWLVSLSLIPNLFGCTTKNILVRKAKNILATGIIQQPKPLLYKDFVSKLYILTALKSGGAVFGGFLQSLYAPSESRFMRGCGRNPIAERLWA